MFNNQKSVIKLAGLALLLTNCGERPTTGNAVGLVVTGSGQSSLVASNSWTSKIFNFFAPKALALDPGTLTSANLEEVVLSHAWIRIKEFEFKMAETEGGETEEQELATGEGREKSDSEIKFKGPYTVDLLSGAPSPIDSQAIALASYRRLKFKIHHEGDVDASSPSELNDHTIYIQGAVAGRVFNYLASDEEEVEIGGPNAVTPTANTSLLLVFRFNEVIAKMDLSTITDGVTISAENRVALPQACPLIDASAEDLYTCFRKGLKASMDFGRDDNDDHDLDSANDEEVEDEVE